jgi:hypothetical protein
MNDDDVLGHGVKVGTGDEDDAVADGEQAAVAAPGVDESAEGRAVVDRSVGDRRYAPEER